MGDLSEHFSKSEMACPHCGQLVIDPKLIEGLEALRTVANAPVRVHDAYRCEEHNKAVGGVAHSEHPLGQAADVDIPGKSLQQMYDLALSVPLFANGGIGLYDTGFIHVDVRGKPARWSRVNNKYLPLEAIYGNSCNSCK